MVYAWACLHKVYGLVSRQRQSEDFRLFIRASFLITDRLATSVQLWMMMIISTYKETNYSKCFQVEKALLLLRNPSSTFAHAREQLTEKGRGQAPKPPEDSIIRWDQLYPRQKTHLVSWASHWS